MNEVTSYRPKDSRSPIDIKKAKQSQIVFNYYNDPAYCPYCGRCPGLERMRLLEPYLWHHHCGAIHDERQVLI